MSRPAVAIVESPFQLLSLLEAMHDGAVDGEVEVLVRGRPGAYRAITGLIDRRGGGVLTLRFGWSDGAVVRRAVAADHLVVGDVLSGLAQLVLVVSGSGPVTLLDDGASMLHAVAVLAEPGRSLVRPRVGPRAGRKALAHRAAATLRQRAERGSLVVSTGFDLGEHRHAVADVRRHAFAWTRGLSPTWWLPERADVVVGAALAADGLIDVARYHAWLEDSVQASTDADRTVVFLPHRREGSASTDVVRASAGLIGSVAGLPLEVLAVAAPVGCTFWMLPSTVALTVELVAPQVRTRVTTVPDDWWSDGAPLVARRFFGDLARGSAGDPDSTDRAVVRPVVSPLRKRCDEVPFSPSGRRAG